MVQIFLQFVRSYNSRAGSFPTYSTAITPAAVPYFGSVAGYIDPHLNSYAPIGANWQANVDYGLAISQGGTPNIAYARRPDGQVVTFTQSGSSWISDTDVDLTLSSGTGGTMVINNNVDGTEVYELDTSGTSYRIHSITSLTGYVETFSYYGLPNINAGRLQSVQDSYSRTLGFAYDSYGNLSQLTTADGQVITYGYTAGGGTGNGTNPDRLSSITYPADSFSAATSKSYLYENTSYPYSMTGLVDENGQRYTTWTYDAYGRGTSSQHAGGADLTSFVYNYDGTVMVTHPLGNSEIYTFQLLQGVPKVVQIARQIFGGTATVSAVPAATATISYDSNGYPASRTDWNGVTTQYTNNSRGLPLTAVEASGTSVQRTTTSTWMSTAHLPLVITKPGLTSTYTYDSATNLLSRADTDTLSGGGFAGGFGGPPVTRTTSFTWLPTGLLATLTSPRTDLTQTTTYTYSSGSMATTTNALGQVLTVTSQTAGGLPLTLVDANGVTMNMVYDGRQRLRSQQIVTAAGNRTTTFTYDAAGNLISTTKPDGSTITNTYDAAHRLIKTTDSLGNSINYTLDANSDHTLTTWSDASNTIWRQQSQRFDALGRVIQSTGGVGQLTTYNYDNNGNNTVVDDPLLRPSF